MSHRSQAKGKIQNSEDSINTLPIPTHHNRASNNPPMIALFIFFNPVLTGFAFETKNSTKKHQRHIAFNPTKLELESRDTPPESEPLSSQKHYTSQTRLEHPS